MLMYARPPRVAKRELMAQGLFWSGITFLLGRMPQRDSLLVLSYHRIGNRDDAQFDPGVFSVTGDQLDEQLTYLKRRVSLVTLEEALAFVEGTLKDRSPRCRVLMTFDDAYRDNYDLAFPILRSHGVQGVFFLATNLVGASDVLWWDHIAYLMKSARRRRFQLSYPRDLLVDLDKNGFKESLRDVLDHFKRTDNIQPARFLKELAGASEGDEPPQCGERRFLNWSEAREMVDGKMVIGSHAHSHAVLSQLSLDRQRQELFESRAILREKLGIEAEALAYPVGGKANFSDETQELAKEAGYRVAFSFYGGTNLPGKTRRYDVKRVPVDHPSRPRFCAQITTCKATGNFWP